MIEQLTRRVGRRLSRDRASVKIDLDQRRRQPSVVRCPYKGLLRSRLFQGAVHPKASNRMCLHIPDMSKFDPSVGDVCRPFAVSRRAHRVLGAGDIGSVGAHLLERWLFSVNK